MGPLIREVTWGSAFDVTLITEAEGTAWRAYKAVSTNFLGKLKAKN